MSKQTDEVKVIKLKGDHFVFLNIKRFDFRFSHGEINKI